MTKKQRARLAKGRESMIAQVRLNVETKTSGSVRHTTSYVPTRNLAPKTGFFTQGQNSGPCFNVTP